VKHSKRLGSQHVPVLHLFCMQVPALPLPHTYTSLQAIQNLTQASARAALPMLLCATGGPHLCQSLLLLLRVRSCAQTLTPCCRDSCPPPAVRGSGPRTRPRHRTCRGQACRAGKRGCQRALRHLQGQQHQHRSRLLHSSGRQFRHSRPSMILVEQLVHSHGNAAVCAVSRRDQAEQYLTCQQVLVPKLCAQV
jgi:hypothetical protein